MRTDAEANLAALIESTEDLIWSVDLDYRLLTFNQAVRDDIQGNFGVRAEVGMRPEDLLPPAVAALWPPLFDRALSEGPFRAEYPLVDGRTLEVSLNRIVQDGETTGISVFGKDITERKTAEAALRKAEEKYRGIFEGALEGIYRTSLEGKLLAANAAAARMLGYDSAQELIAAIADTAHQVWLDPDGRSQVLRLLERDGVVRGYECQYKRKDGTAIWVSLNCRNVCGENGRALYNEGFIVDITERKRMQDALRKSEEMFGKAFRDSPVAMLLAKIESEGNRLIDANEAFERVSGYRREEVIGRFAQHELGLFADTREFVEWIEQFRAAGRVRNFEFHFRKKSGEIGTGLISAESMELDGQPWLISSTIDITERKAAEQDRRQSERQYRSLFNSMQEGVALHKLIRSNGVPENYILVDVNRRYEELLGMKHEHVVDRLATDVYGAEAAPYLQEYALVVEGGKPLQFETYFSPLDKHFVVSVTPMGEDLFATIFFDVTEQKIAQERYRLISENAADVIWMFDLEEGRCVYVSPSVQQLRGFSPEEILAQPMDQAMPDDTYRMVLGEIQRCRAAVESGDESMRIRTNEIEFICKNGTTVATETVTKLVSDARGKVRYVVGTSRDITGLKRAEAEKAKIEDELRQTQKLESVGRLAAGVAHDFNNLLTVINGYSRLLLGSLKADDPLRGGLEEIHKAGERAAALIQQLLAFSRKQILQPRVLDLNRVVEEMRPMLERLMGEDVEVCVQSQAEAAAICADPHQLEQVLMNLAVNSRDAMPDGGKFSIETGFVEWDESQAQLRPGAHAGTYVMLSVSDTGEGMSEETRGHIFEPFFTTKEVGKGTGLGLSTIHGIVEQSGGCVEVASEPGRGTTFKIYMPRVVDAPAESGSPEAVPEMGGKETVLVVEDQTEVREYAATALRAYGYQVMEAANAEEALLVCEREGERIDLILTDVVMPGLSGRELADRLKQRGYGIKVLFMSGHTDDMILHHGVLRKEAEFIQKPFGPGQLAMKVREMLRAADRPARIVVADDEAGVRSFLRLVLEGAGYEVMEAPNGKLVLQEARAGRVDLVITDLVMPEQEGMETIRALRREVPGVGIIAISGALGPQFLEVARTLGAQAVLSKPLSAELLLAEVAEVLKSRR
jgi:PAS domain S-box-containing protein